LKTIGKSSHNGGTNSTKDPFKRFVGKDNESLRSELIQELTEYALPKRSGDIQLLVVVTTMKSENGFQRKGVWRGLSSRIESEDWVELDAERIEEPDSQKKTRPGFGILVALFVVGLIAVTALFLINHPTARDSQPESIDPSKLGLMETVPQHFLS
ncbi:MAG: hypothetical protein WA984_09770, partial [Phormidesmis sp.]